VTQKKISNLCNPAIAKGFTGRPIKRLAECNNHVVNMVAMNGLSHLLPTLLLTLAMHNVQSSFFASTPLGDVTHG